MENFKKGGYDRRPAEGRREYGSRPGRNEGRPGRSFGEHNDRPRRSFGDSSDRPRRSFGENSDRPRRSYGEGFDRPRRSFGDNSDRPRRSYGDNSDRPRKSFGEGSDRPRRSFGDNQDRPHRQFGEGNDRPRRTFGENSDRAKLRPRKKSAPAESAADQGINRMISRKQVIDDTQFSDNDYVNIPVKETVRLNKFIANSGICSRREADNFIQAGVVTVNGEVVTELGTKININTDDIRFNGERLRGEAKVYIIMNKPKGYVTTASDPHADKTVMDLIKKCPARVFPVGRLDKNTTGVLMFTNDGEMAEKLTHPSYEKKKIYQVTLSSKLSQEDFDKILAGVSLNDGEIKADELEYIDDNDHRKIGIEIHSGKNRIVRRIFESLGYEVKGLDRVYFAGLTKKGIKRGGWRYLTDGEINILRMGAYK